jgi:hypothetical protein
MQYFLLGQKDTYLLEHLDMTDEGLIKDIIKENGNEEKFLELGLLQEEHYNKEIVINGFITTSKGIELHYETINN